MQSRDMFDFNNSKKIRKKSPAAVCGQRLLHFIVFALVLSVFVYAINHTLRLQYQYSNSSTPMTSTYSGFYEMDRDSIDVLLMGTSHAGTGLNPQDMYDAAGIRSYNLASNSQYMWMTYYWLVEALQYQSPKVVVLDCLSLFEGMYWNDATARLAFDGMRDGPVKAEAVQLLSNWEEEGIELSYHFFNIRYHTRWLELEQEDFLWMREDPGIKAKGFYCAWGVDSENGYCPLDLSAIDETEPADIYPETLEYMDRITALCEEEGIELVLIKTPALSQTVNRSRTIQDYAENHGLLYYDFNDSVLYEEIGYDSETDMYDDDSHSNPSGARKISVYLANALLGVNGLESVCDEQYESSREFNEHCWQNFQLSCEEDFLSYLVCLDQDRYTILISAKDEASSSITDEIVEAMRMLGFSFDLKDHLRYSYIAVRNNGEITELLDGGALEANGALQDGSIPLIITSAGTNAGNSSSILIGGVEYSVNSRGLNIVIYDNEIHRVIDSVCFDTYDPAWTAVRWS